MRITVKPIEDSGSNTEYDYKSPDLCPICGVAHFPHVLSAWNTEAQSINYVVEYCPACKNCFIVYSVPSHTPTINGSTNMLLAPKRCFDVPIDPIIEELSPQFVEIYKQAYSAEQEYLLQICGLGYRKALEFLVKDYAIHFHPDAKEKILKTPLSKCITQYVEYPKLQSVASRAVWLGNDHAHYIPKHPEKDLEDLKSLLHLTIHWVAMELGTEKAESIQPR